MTLLSLTQSTSSAVKTTHPQFCGPSATLVENIGTRLNMKGDPMFLKEIYKWNTTLMNCAAPTDEQ
jgi:hypothetical protein